MTPCDLSDIINFGNFLNEVGAQVLSLAQAEILKGWRRADDDGDGLSCIVAAIKYRKATVNPLRPVDATTPK